MDIVCITAIMTDIPGGIIIHSQFCHKDQDLVALPKRRLTE